VLKFLQQLSLQEFRTMVNRNLSSQAASNIYKPWYNRPLVGNKSVVQHVANIFHRQEVPEDITFIYQRNLDKMTPLADLARGLDREKFTNDEFLYYVKISLMLKRNQGDYAGLEQYFELLTIALATKESFIKVQEIEFCYRGTKQQEFYTYVDSLLEANYTGAEFNEKVHEKLLQVSEDLYTIEGQESLNGYQRCLLNISDYNLGLKLLSLFKKHEYGNFTILKKLGEFVEKLVKSDLRSLNNFLLVVRVNYDIFERLGRIIQLPQNKSIPSVYSLMLQYMSLHCKHMLSYSQFQELVATLVKWQLPYRENQAILQTYNTKEYKTPKVFRQNMPGLEIYGKYDSLLP
jgi:hypothetical protein